MRDLIIFLYIRVCPHQVAPTVKIMPRPFFHAGGIACRTTCGKVPMAKMETVKDLIIISHSYCFFLMKNGMHVKLTLIDYTRAQVANESLKSYSLFTSYA